MFWIFLFSPLLGFLFNALFWKRLPKNFSGPVTTLSCLLSFLIGSFYFLTYKGLPQSFSLFPWISLGSLKIDFSFTLDSLSLLMILLITGVGSIIHLYSISYMKKEAGRVRYFAYLNLFVFNMLLLVLADNLLLMFVGWEGVGLCSYLLIGFWFEDFKKVGAGMRAFLVNRVGDAGFLVGIFLLFSKFDTVYFSEINSLILKEESGSLFLTMASLFLFLGACGKSAQIPLYFWLPKAMAGPTPVSALIHAATMVTAGVYMISRLFPLFQISPLALSVVTWTGALTALFSALIASKIWDFKRILAFSTCSQLAYMFMALGGGAVREGVFHLFTHGFFKALLFLCAGSVIHSLEGEQDIRFMGGLKKYLPQTFWAYLIGALCLIALPPFSGFFSKDAILFSLFSSGNYGVWGMAFLTALLTTFYMTRLTYFVFFAKENFKTKPHKDEKNLWIPLVGLASLSLLVGSLGIPSLFSDFLPFRFPHFINVWLKDFSFSVFPTSHTLEFGLMAFSIGASLTVLFLTANFYFNSSKETSFFFESLFEKEFYIEEGLKKFITEPVKNLSFLLFKNIDESFLQRSFFVLVKQVSLLRSQLASRQNGDLQTYSFYFVIGLSGLVVLIFMG